MVVYLYIFPNVEYRTILYLHILLNGTLLRNLDFYHLTFSKTFKSFSKLFPEIGKQTKSFLTWKPTNCKIYNLENQSLLFQFPIKLCVVSRKVSFSFREIAFRKYSFLSLNIKHFVFELITIKYVKYFCDILTLLKSYILESTINWFYN